MDTPDKICIDRMVNSVHEAGHAVIGALAGHEVELVAVKIPGDEERFRQAVVKLFGDIADDGFGGFVYLSADAVPGVAVAVDAGPGEISAIDGEAFAVHIQSLDPAGQEEARRAVRALVCMSLAGIVASKILRDQGGIKVPQRIFALEQPDYREAANLSKLLDGGKTLARCMEATEAALVAHSPQLTKIAAIAYTIGLVGGQGLQEILPKPLHGWPAD